MKKNLLEIRQVLFFFLLVFSLFVICCLSVGAVSYYLSNDGADSNNGTSELTPWENISYLNTKLGDGTINIGDDIFFRCGDVWAEELDVGIDAGLDLRLGGTGGNHMVIGSYGSGNKPVINNTDVDGGTTQGTSAYSMTCDNSIGYIDIDNINFTGNAGNEYALVFFAQTADYNNITFTDCDFYNSGLHGLFMFRIVDFSIENCMVNPRTSGGSGIVVYGFSSGVLPSNGIIRNCTVHGCKDGISFHHGGGGDGDSLGENFWVSNCTVYNNAATEEGIDMVGGSSSGHYLVEDTVLHNCADSYAIGHSVNNVTIRDCFAYSVTAPVTISNCKDVIIRNCVFQNWNGAKNCISFSSSTINNMSIYNNDFIILSGGVEDAYQIGSGIIVDKIISKNNIFYSHTSTDPSTFWINYLTGTFASTNSSFVNNLWWRGDGGSGGDEWWHEVGNNYNWTEWLSASFTTGDIRSNASLVNPSGIDFDNDFVLNVSSPCIDAGDWLTYTVGGNTGTVITVNDSSYFFAGISALDIVGDNVFVGDDKNLEIVSVNYNLNTITVDRSITWSDGEDVSLSGFSGVAPDIGAVEYTGYILQRGNMISYLIISSLFIFLGLVIMSILFEKKNKQRRNIIYERY